MDPAMVKNLALGAVPPLVLMLVYFAIVHRRRGAEQAWWVGAVTPLVMALAVVVTYAIAFQMPTLSARASFEWLPIAAIAAGIAGAVASMERWPALVRWTPAVLAVLFGAWASARNLIGGSWSAAQTGAYLVEAGVTGVVLLGAGHVLVAKRAGIVPALVLMLFAGAASQLLVLGFFSMKVSQVAGMGASMMMAAVAVAFRRPTLRVGSGAMVFIVALSLTALAQGRLYGQATPEFVRIYAALLTLSLVGGALVQAWVADRWSARVRGAMVLGAVALPLVVGIGIAGAKWQADEKGGEEGEDPYAMPAPGVTEQARG